MWRSPIGSRIIPLVSESLLNWFLNQLVLVEGIILGFGIIPHPFPSHREYPEIIHLKMGFSMK